MTTPLVAAGERVLVVDDEADIVALVAYHLAKAGYRVSTATSGPDALAAGEPAMPTAPVSGSRAASAAFMRGQTGSSGRPDSAPASASAVTTSHAAADITAPRLPKTATCLAILSTSLPASPPSPALARR